MATIDQYKRFLANEPEAQIEYRTIEIWHPQMASVQRFINAYSSKSLGLDASAPRNASETVLFDGSTLEITEPAERNDSDQVLVVSFGNVDGRVHDMIDQISGSGFLNQVELVYRKYLSGDLTQAVTSPLYLSISSISFDGPTVVSFTAEDADLSAKRSGTLYTFEQFPGLKD